jgi:hypothetical protein
MGCFYQKTFINFKTLPQIPKVFPKKKQKYQKNMGLDLTKLSDFVELGYLGIVRTFGSNFRIVGSGMGKIFRFMEFLGQSFGDLGIPIQPNTHVFFGYKCMYLRTICVVTFSRTESSRRILYTMCVNIYIEKYHSFRA